MGTSEVIDLIGALKSGEMSLDEVSARFRGRKWPRTRGPLPQSYAELADAAQLDPAANVPGSYDEVTAAYDRGEITCAQYDALSAAIAASIRAESQAAELRP
jgi:hypothetical protein